MQALRFDCSLGRLAATTLLSRVWRGACTSAFSPLKLVDLPEPKLPGADWVLVRTRLAGICGSDLKQKVAFDFIKHPTQ